MKDDSFLITLIIVAVFLLQVSDCLDTQKIKSLDQRIEKLEVK